MIGYDFSDLVKLKIVDNVYNIICWHINNKNREQDEKGKK